MQCRLLSYKVQHFFKLKKVSFYYLTFLRTLRNSSKYIFYCYWLMNCYFLIVFFGNKNQNRSIIHLEASVFFLFIAQNSICYKSHANLQERDHTQSLVWWTLWSLTFNGLWERRRLLLTSSQNNLSILIFPNSDFLRMEILSNVVHLRCNRNEKKKNLGHNIVIGFCIIYSIHLYLLVWRKHFDLLENCAVHSKTP